MSQQVDFLQGDTFQKLSSAGFIIGVVLWVISSLLMLRIISSASNMQEELKSVGEHAVIAQVGELLYAFSALAVMIGMAGVYRSITMIGAAWARIGFYIFGVATVLWIVGYSLDVAVASAAANWQAATDVGKETAYNVVAALSAISRGTFPLGVIIYWLAFIFLGIGMAGSAIYPSWLGWLGLLLGVTGVALGTFQIFNGRESTFNLFVVLFALTTLWCLVLGIWVARRAW